MNQYRPQAQRRDGSFTFFVSLLVFAGIAIPAALYIATTVMPSIQSFLDSLSTTP